MTLVAVQCNGLPLNAQVPGVYLSDDPRHPRFLASLTPVSATRFVSRFDMPSGFHVLMVQSRNGFASILLDFLPNVSRHVVVSICDYVSGLQSLRSVSVLFPGPGFDASLSVAGSADERMVIDGDAAYLQGLDSGDIWLTVSYGQREGSGTSCEYDLGAGPANWRYQHIRVALSWASLQPAFYKDVQCGRVIPIPFHGTDYRQ